MKHKGTLYNTLTIEAARTGWIVRQKGKPAEIFTLWDQVVKKLEAELTSKGAETQQ